MSQLTKSARRSLTWLVAIIAVLYGLLGAGVAFWGASWTPGLALDLAGGRTIIMVGETTNGEEITQSDLDQAVEIIRRRIDASGVAEAEITTQGNDTIVVSLPGNPSEDTVDLVRQSAQLQFRPVLVAGAPTPAQNPTTSPTPEPAVDPSASPAPSASAEPAASAEPDAGDQISEAPGATPTPEPSEAPAPVAGETDPSSFTWLTDDLLEVFESLDCTNPASLIGGDLGDPDAGFVACDENGLEKYALGPVELTGSEIATASSGPRLDQFGNALGDYAVKLEFTSAGARTFDEISQRLIALDPDRNRFAMVLDGVVISAPTMNDRISNGEAQITGGNPGFTADEAQRLANQLKFGALPLTLTVQSEQQVGATLGADQLQAGLLAGAIGLILVVVYSLIQYRALGLVTVASLLIAGSLTYVIITLLSWGIGYRLSLAGVAGLIIAIGITADSFIVYFERVRDELREGRSLTSAVEHAWKRARRTILASDAVSLLAAVTLYLLAVGGVRGFAFTLGLTTLVDIVVVFLFTHPILALLSKTKFFGEGHRLSGLDPKQLGRDSLYKGRGRFVTQATEGPTLAERKAAERRAATDKGGDA